MFGGCATQIKPEEKKKLKLCFYLSFLPRTIENRTICQNYFYFIYNMTTHLYAYDNRNISEI